MPLSPRTRPLTTAIAAGLAAATIGATAAGAAGNLFGDVDDGAYYATAVTWAAEEGITQGTSPGVFSPDQTVDRGQMVTFLKRMNDNVVEPAIEELRAETVRHADIVIDAGAAAILPTQSIPASAVSWTRSGTYIDADGGVMVDISGPTMVGGEAYRLESVGYCIGEPVTDSFVSGVTIAGLSEAGDVVEIFDDTDRVDAGCYLVTAPPDARTGYGVGMFIRQPTVESILIRGVESTWVPVEE